MSFKVMSLIVLFCVVISNVTAEKQDEVQDSPIKSSLDVLVPDVKKSTNEEITTPKSVIIDALVKINESTATATVSTLAVETTTEEEDDGDDDEYGQTDVVQGIDPKCVLSLCGPIGK